MLKGNTLIKSGWAFERQIAGLKGNLVEEKARVVQLETKYDNLETEYDNLRAQSQSKIQNLSNSFKQLNFQMSTAKASAVEECKTFAKFANIIDEEFWKGATKVKSENIDGKSLSSPWL